MSDVRENLLLFFDRPKLPIFMKKGENNMTFEIPAHYYPEEYKHFVKQINRKKSPAESTDKIISVIDVPLPDLSIPMQLPKDKYFTILLPKHREMAAKLIDIFMNTPTLKEFESILAYCQLRINPYMFNYCLSVAILNRPDTKGMEIPTYAETFPEKFVDHQSMHRAREYISMLPEGSEIPIIKAELPINQKNPEMRLAYYREDLGLNSHHFHWHLIYISDSTNKDVIVNKDRRGELFYYMHHQMMARYDVERMCNGLARVKPYENFRKPLAEGYFPGLDSSNASHIWPPRFDNMLASDIDRSDLKSSVADMEIWRQRIQTAIKNQSVLLPDGTEVPLEDDTGIDILGNIVESTAISYNRDYYGNYHNHGHVLIGFMHDPKERHMQPFGVMGELATAPRDPAFYLWHEHIDDIFLSYKNNLKPYSSKQLGFPDISVTSVTIEGVSGQNAINTLWERSMVDVSNGLDFQRRQAVYVELTHLQHEEFDYVININNTSGENHTGTVRIFLAPTVDESGKPLTFEDQRRLVIELDKFSHPLRPGQNKICRSSEDSSVTIPLERIYRDRSNESRPSICPRAKFCDCGWPQYLLVPRGTPEGYPMMLFVMVSNWDDDKVQREPIGEHNSASYCGLRDHKYPDKRSMGFPFDRKFEPHIDSFEKLLHPYPNMGIRECFIKFTDRTRDQLTLKKKKLQLAHQLDKCQGSRCEM